jgi:hypothetical protein
VAPAGSTGTGGVFFLRHQRAGPPGAVVACYPPHAVLAQPVTALNLYFVAKPKHLTGSIHEASTLILKQAAHIRVQLHVLGYLHNHVAPSHGPWASPARSVGLTVMSVGALHRLNAVPSRHVRWHRTASQPIAPDPLCHYARRASMGLWGAPAWPRVKAIVYISNIRITYLSSTY